MTTEDAPGARLQRMKWAGSAGLARAAFQLAATRRTSLDYRSGAVAINVVPVLLLSWLTLRGSKLAASRASRGR